MVAEWVDKGKAMGLPAGNILSCSIGQLFCAADQ